MPQVKRDITTEEMDWWKGIGRRMKAARKARGISQQDFAKMLDLSNNGYCNFENGKGVFNLYLFYKACTLLGKCANSMMGRRVKAKGK